MTQSDEEINALSQEISGDSAKWMRSGKALFERPNRQAFLTLRNQPRHARPHFSRRRRVCRAQLPEHLSLRFNTPARWPNSQSRGLRASEVRDEDA